MKNHSLSSSDSSQSLSPLTNSKDQTHEQLIHRNPIRQNQQEHPTSNNQRSCFSLTQTDMKLQILDPIKQKTRRRRRRGKPNKQDSFSTSLYMQQIKQKKIAKIQQYQNALKKIRTQPKQFHQPFQSVKLNLDKQHILQMCKQAKNLRKNLRVAVRGVGIRHQRNLFNCGVNQQLDYVINYLQTGKLPKWMIDNFQDLLEKDLSKSQKIIETKIQS